jgi:hypothetical protein
MFIKIKSPAERGLVMLGWSGEIRTRDQRIKRSHSSSKSHLINSLEDQRMTVRLPTDASFESVSLR